MPTAAWVMLVLLVDVAHVHSTLYRTYFDGETFKHHRQMLISIPLFCLIGSVLLYSIGGYMIFWRVIAYIAVFHFIRQQYGFMRIYSRKEGNSVVDSDIDKLAIYSATIFPIIYWHLSGPRNFDWFVSGDFFYFPSLWLFYIAGVIYVLGLVAYIVKEIMSVIKTSYFNWPKNMVVAGTYISWFFGIIYYNGDLAFTALNVISHGVPYMALIWIYGKKRTIGAGANVSGFMKLIFSRYGILLFLLIIFGLAYLEEGLWDALVWNDHGSVFRPFYCLPHIADSLWLSILVPLLILPQLTHYIIDGFIWKIQKDNFTWKNFFIQSTSE